MNSPFKFPRRVRIHGGECGAVARALHHEAQKVALTQNEQTLISDECSLLHQADLKKSFGSTFIERKQMSTKTLRKRIALVAVSALGFGLMSVVPAKAADGLTTLATAAADYVLETTVGVEASTTVSVTTGAAANATPTADEVITSTLTLGFSGFESHIDNYYFNCNRLDKCCRNHCRSDC
jgi:hypothetical protein